LAKPELARALERIKSQITVDKKSESVLIRNLMIKDHEVYELVSDQKKRHRSCRKNRLCTKRIRKALL